MLPKFLNITRNFFAYIDNGTIFREPFKWLYAVLSVLSALLPLVILVSAFKMGLFSGQFKVVMAFLLIWVFILVAGAMGCLLWWDRKGKISLMAAQQGEFVATPIFSHYIQTTGEWLAIYVAIVGTGVSLIAAIFLGNEGSYMLDNLLPGGLKIGFAGVLAFPVIGFLILVFFRFIAEQIKALASIANNTAKPQPAAQPLSY